jgi:two-component system chemotaxis response regulator CheY
MHVGLVTPPGVLGDFVARALEPAGHALSVQALFEQAERKPDVVLFAPIVEDRPAQEALSRARRAGFELERALYLGLVPADCTRMQRAGFARCLGLPFQARDLLEALESSARGKLRVLLVDDSALIHKHTLPLLTAAGYEVSSTAVDGQDGLEKAKLERPELVLTDYDMPRMNGFELVLGLRRDPTTRDIPLVMLTARESKRDQAQMRAAGLTSYLVKPSLKGIDAPVSAYILKGFSES